MKKYFIILVLITACNSNPVIPPGNGGESETVLVDRTGITDSIHLDSGNTASKLFFFLQNFTVELDTVRISFKYSGNSLPTELVGVQDGSGGTYIYKFGNSFVPNTTYQQLDTSFSIDTLVHPLRGFLTCRGTQSNSFWFAVKDFKLTIK